MKYRKNRLPDSKPLFVKVVDDPIESSQDAISFEKKNFSDAEIRVLIQQVEMLTQAKTVQAIALALNQSKKEIERLLAMLKLVAKKKVHRTELIGLGALFHDFAGVAILEGIKFTHFHIRVDWFRVVEQ